MQELGDVVNQWISKILIIIAKALIQRRLRHCLFFTVVTLIK